MSYGSRCRIESLVCMWCWGMQKESSAGFFWWRLSAMPDSLNWHERSKKAKFGGCERDRHCVKYLFCHCRLFFPPFVVFSEDLARAVILPKCYRYHFGYFLIGFSHAGGNLGILRDLFCLRLVCCQIVTAFLKILTCLFGFS